MEPEYTPPMSGSNSICVATVLLDAGIVGTTEPETTLRLEAPGGLIEVKADCRDGKAERIYIQNMPSFAHQLDVPLDVEGLGNCGLIRLWWYSFVIVDVAQLGIDLVADNARRIAELGVVITRAANQQLTFHHPDHPDWAHFSFCLFAGAIRRDGNHLHARSAVAIEPGKVDRSPTGTAVSARMAVLHAKGEMTGDDIFMPALLLILNFKAGSGTTSVGSHPAITPEISGRAWITGTHHHMLDPDDPWPEGYRISDTWGF